MKLHSIETRDELSFVAFGERSRNYQAGTPPCARLEADLPCRVVWIWIGSSPVPHGIPLEQIRRFSPTEELVGYPAGEPKPPIKLSVVKPTGAPKPAKK